MTIQYSDYRRRVEGCWLGKSVGGTLGGPYEGDGGPLSLTYYDPVPTGMLPNDDLDLQVIWLQTIRRRGLPVNRRDLADAWIEHVHLWPDEYGVAARNVVAGIYPPASGAFDNNFSAGMGAAIRTELWACIAPGDPELATRLAAEDACADHRGEGVHAAVFLAALESLAFVEHDRDVLLDNALGFIPSTSRLHSAIVDTREWLSQGLPVAAVRERILAEHSNDNWTDVVPNLSFIVLGWVLGNGHFSDSLCAAVNCGLDTDCTGATLGALLGIIDPDSIGEKWLKPIGNELVLSPGMVGITYPRTLDELGDHVASLATQALAYYGSTTSLEGAEEATDSIRVQIPASIDIGVGARPAEHESLLSVAPVIARITYGENIAFIPGRAEDLLLTCTNPTNRTLSLALEARGPDGWDVRLCSTVLELPAGATEELPLSVTAPSVLQKKYRNALDIHLSSEGLSWTVTAGLPQAIPWRRTLADRSTEEVFSPTHTQTVPTGAVVLETDLKIPYAGTFVYVTQGTRRAKTYLDGELINEYAGDFFVPAMHRSKTGSDVSTARGWHRVRIEVEDGEVGELFFGVGERRRFAWIVDLEWRAPHEGRL